MLSGRQNICMSGLVEDVICSLVSFFHAGTLMSFVVVEVYNERRKWQFTGHSEVSEMGDLSPVFSQCIKVLCVKPRTFSLAYSFSVDRDL